MNTINRVTFSHDGRRLATAGWDRTARVWDLSSGQELFTFSQTSEVQGVAFSPRGTHLATTSEDRTLRIYILDIEELKALAQTRVTREWTDEERLRYLHR